MIQQIIELARTFNSPSRVNMTDIEKVAGAFCLFLLIMFFVVRDAALFITAPLWIIPYLTWRKFDNGRKENNS